MSDQPNGFQPHEQTECPICRRDLLICGGHHPPTAPAEPLEPEVEPCDGHFDDHPASQFPDTVRAKCQLYRGHDGPCCSLAEYKRNMTTEAPTSAAPAESLMDAQKRVDDAAGRLLIEVAFLMPRGTDMQTHPIHATLAAYKAAIEARALQAHATQQAALHNLAERWYLLAHDKTGHAARCIRDCADDLARVLGLSSSMWLASR